MYLSPAKCPSLSFQKPRQMPLFGPHFIALFFIFHDSGTMLQTDINIKPTDARVYLHYSSFHPRQTFKSIVYSQCLRYRRIINDYIRLARRLQDLRECFIESGYPSQLVDGVIKDVSSRKRNLDYSKKDKTPPNEVLWVQTFGPASNDIQDAVKEANTMLQKSPAWSDNKKVIGVVSRRPKNLGDLILTRKKFALDTSFNSEGTVRCSPLPVPGVKHKAGRPCESCDLMSSNNHITSTANGKTFKTPKANCKSRNLVYCAMCIHCSKQYSGKTTGKMQKRVCGHRGHMYDVIFDDSDEATLAQHLKTDHNFDTIELFNLSYVFTILEISPHDLDKCEQKWISRLTTMAPFGLNKNKPGGITDTVKSMCRKSLGHTSQRP